MTDNQSINTLLESLGYTPEEIRAFAEQVQESQTATQPTGPDLAELERQYKAELAGIRRGNAVGITQLQIKYRKLRDELEHPQAAAKPKQQRPHDELLTEYKTKSWQRLGA